MEKQTSKHAALWLAVGVLFVFAANLRWGIGILAWLAPAALLRYLRVTSGWRSRLAFAGALCLAWIAATFKIVSAPLPLAFGMLGAGFALFHLVGYLGADAIRRRAGEGWGTLAFPAAMAVVEGVQHRCTELASWTAAAYTQLDDLPLLQVASFAGIAGVGFLVHAFAATLESALRGGIEPAERRSSRRRLAAASGAVLAAHAFGALRLALPVAASSADMTRVAAIGTDATFDGHVMPTKEERARTLDRLATDTRAAARAGAKLAVWTEAGALAMPDEEQAMLDTVRDLAKSERIDVVAGYVVPLSSDPLRFENKYAWFRSDGTLDHTYFKHHPAPGEPAVVGTAPLSAVGGDFGRASGALCYDYDFPAFARQHGALDVDLVALPSSDWRGIDPIHTQMAALRAIEEGVSIVRSTRFGLSAGFDPFGRIRAQRSSFESDERVLVIDLPRHGVRTVYRSMGDAFVYACSALVLAALVALFSTRLSASVKADRMVPGR